MANGQGTSAEAIEAVASVSPPSTLSKEALADRTRFRFKEEVLEIPELGGSIKLKSLSVEEREALPGLVDEDDESANAVAKLAQVFSVIVAEPKVTPEEAEKFLGDWPAEALDRIVAKYGELTGNKEEEQAAAAEFQGAG